MSFAQDLRASVLQAAMQGKLTEQFETDTPVSELLNQISTTTKKKIVLMQDDDLPEGWASVKITDIATIYTGNSIAESVKTAKYCGLKEGYDYIGTKDVNFDHTICYDNGVRIPFNEPNFRYAEKDATLLCIEGGSAGRKIAILDKKVCFGNKLCSFHPIGIEKKFLYYYLQSPQFLGMFTNSISGIIGGVSINKIKQMNINLPPIEEQKRIVRRIEEIMIRINELEAIEEELKKLKEVFPADMKAAVLQAAMQGKLTEQLEADSSVDDLLEDIKAERDKLVKEGKIKKSRTQQNSNFVELNSDEMPFEIPDNWRWVKLGRITYNHGQKTPDKSFSYIDIGSINNEKQTLNVAETIIEPEKAPSRARKIVNTDDILYSTVRPYLHNMCIVNKSFSAEPIASTGFAVMKCNTGIYNKYLFFYLMSPQFDLYANATDNSKGVAYPAINDEKLFSAYIPIPPLEEQNRIVAKLEQILPLISDLS